ncbi:MAG TPA: Tricorn protease like protein, partial [Saprospiraceae bacterium]|nr:Tricorn protease like protein [Saprospiraceae bacterium]
MKFSRFFVLPLLFSGAFLSAQTPAGLFRYPDVSEKHIVFSCANNLWLVAKQGGEAVQLSSPPGMESFPKFSPDGSKIAYSANYDGHVDVYLMDIQGGVPRRMTQHGMADQVIDWHPDGKRILFASDREIEKDRFGQFYTIDQNGGPATKLPLAYAEFGSYSPDGHQMALVFETQAFSTWKRYRGGNAADIYLFDFRDSSSSNISNAIDAGEEFPMWHGSQIYFISDNGPEKRWNLWSFDPKTKLRKQLTFYSEFDIHNPSLGPDEIVFAANGKIHLYAFNSGQTREIQIQLISDLTTIKGGIENADKFIQNACISKDGNRVILEARGELFSLPAEFGNVKNLTQSPGHAERNPSWSPDGRSLAYWSDASGEYELWIKNMDRSGETRKISNYGAGFRYRLFWSPDSKKLVFINQAMEIKMIDLEKNTTVTVDKGLRWLHGGLLSFTASWSPDSRWLSYGRDLDNWHQAIFIYDVQNQKTRQVTSGFYDCGSPAFDPEGKYLYVLTSQFFQPLYSDLDNTFIYANSTQLAAIPLRANTPSLLYARNDTVAFDKPEQGEARNSDSKSAKKSDAVKKDSMSSAKEKVAPVEIDFDQMEMRMEILPLSAGNYDRLSAVKGKILYLKYPLTGSGEQVKTSIRFYDIEKREEKTILEDANSYQLSADGKKILATRSGSYAVIKSEENQKFEKPLRIAEMEMAVDPKSEWKQIF